MAPLKLPVRTEALTQLASLKSIDRYRRLLQIMEWIANEEWKKKEINIENKCIYAYRTRENVRMKNISITFLKMEKSLQSKFSPSLARFELMTPIARELAGVYRE